MRTRVLIVLAIVLVLSLGAVSRPVPAYAIQTYISQVSGQCGAISADVTLLHISDDGSGEDKYWFRVFEADTATELVHVEESIARSESPFFWQTGTMNVNTGSGLYRLELWDVAADGQLRGPVETVFYQCHTGASWRPDGSYPQDPDIPAVACWVEVPVWSRNTAPEPGTVLAVWSYGRKQTDDEFHVGTVRLSQGARLHLDPGLQAPCGVYLRLYWRPDSTGKLLYLESQYHPHDNYGTPGKSGQRGPWYTTRFPEKAGS